VAMSNASAGTGNVMNSTDGATWTSQSTTPVSDVWESVTYGNGYFAAISSSAIIRSSDNGVTWTGFGGIGSNTWTDIEYGNGLFVAVASGGTTTTNLMTSTNLSTWVSRTSPNAQAWQSVAYGNGMFVAVANNGTTSTNNMTSGFNDYNSLQNNNVYQGGMTIQGLASDDSYSGVCISATGVLSVAAATCTNPSARRFKSNIETLRGNLDKVKLLRPVSYTLNRNNKNYVGFIAEEVATIEDRLVSYDDSTGQIVGLNYAQFAPLFAGAIQELNFKFNDIDVSHDGSLASLMRSYVENTANGIRTLFADKVQTKELCLEDVCVTKNQLQQILNSSGISSNISPPNQLLPDSSGGAEIPVEVVPDVEVIDASGEGGEAENITENPVSEPVLVTE
jgi:Chaperone of endosialidase